MRNRISVALSWLGICCACLAGPTASAQHNAPPGGPAQQRQGTNPNAPGRFLSFCLTPSSAQRVIYFSAITPVSATATQGDREASFAAYLQKQYGYRTSTSCGDVNISTSQAATDFVTYRQQKIADYRSAGYTVIETDWTYTPVTNAPAVPASAAPRPVETPRNSTPARGAVVVGGPTSYATCWADSPGPTAYFSAPFGVGKHDYAAWSQAFTQVLVQKYGYAGAVRCFAHANQADAQSNLQARINALRATRKIIETGWSYTPGQNAPPSGRVNLTPAVAPAALRAAGIAPLSTPTHSTATPPTAGAATAGLGTLYAICWGQNRGPSVYFSAPFAVTTRNSMPWLKAYRSTLQEKYGVTGEVRCDVQASLAQAQNFLQRRLDALHATKKIVETGWKFE